MACWGYSSVALLLVAAMAWGGLDARLPADRGAGFDFYPAGAAAASHRTIPVRERLISRRQNLDVALAIEPGAPRPL